jgi:hypothetical protein
VKVDGQPELPGQSAERSSRTRIMRGTRTVGAVLVQGRSPIGEELANVMPYEYADLRHLCSTTINEEVGNLGVELETAR